MKLVIQIPCFNEERTLPDVLSGIPRRIDGLADIELLVVDDGSTDNTAHVARSCGVAHVLVLPGPNQRRLGCAFQAGVDYALRCGADILVNTDGDNQYPSENISDLIQPILRGEADVVIGNRRPWRCNRFSLWKRVLQLSGNLAVSALAARIIPDAVSGFRAYSRKALLSGSIETPYTYTVESVLKCCYNGLRVAWIPIEVNPPTRSSRLMRHPLEMVFRCAYSALRVSLSMRPLRTVLMLALPLLAVGALALQRLPVVQTMYTTLYRLPVDDKALFTPSLLLAAFFGATLVLVIIRSFCLRRTRRTLAHSDMV